MAEELQKWQVEVHCFTACRPHCNVALHRFTEMIGFVQLHGTALSV